MTIDFKAVCFDVYYLKFPLLFKFCHLSLRNLFSKVN